MTAPPTPQRLQRSALPSCGRLDGLRVFSRLVTGTLIGVFIGAFIAPWTQSASGSGRVVAYSPVDRETPIRAPIDGRVVRWLVNEGDYVRQGQALAELADNDAQILSRLGRVRDAALVQGDAVESALVVAQEQVSALSDARDAALDNAKAKVAMTQDKRAGARQKVLAAEAKKATAELNLTRQRDLNTKGLSSNRELELAQLDAATARSEEQESRANLRAAEQEVTAAVAYLEEVREKNRASIEKAKGELAKLRAKAGEVDAKAAQAETELSRQEQQTIYAPRTGQILSVEAREGTDFVKTGQQLAVLVPETRQRAVEIWVDGNDAPLVSEGRGVRLQFEGWPAVQFVGWPSVAVGTFGGKVAFVDPASRGDGKFRVMVIPDDDEEPWPDGKYLRQGVRAKGWILLNRVTVAYELWRQFNGFPPAMPEPPRGSHPDGYSKTSAKPLTEAVP